MRLQMKPRSCKRCLRSRVATATANAGVNDRLFKRHGCWRPDKAKDGYVKDNLEALLSVSKSLEI